MSGTKKYQIFVSSTFEDLEEERRLVIEQILNMGHIPVGMELFQASNDEQWDYIRRRIDQCDYYLVVVAERYGACASDGLSFTEKEYRYAIDQKIPVAALVLSAKARKNWPSGKVQKEHQDKLESFRTFCTAAKMSKFWDDAKDLALKATHSIHGLISDFPRPGLVPASEAPSSATIAELARLSDENNKLRSEIKRLGTDAPDARATEVITVMRKHKLQSVLGGETLSALNPTQEWSAHELFYDIASAGELKITNALTGEWIALRLGIEENETTKSGLSQLGFVFNDRLSALGLLIRDTSQVKATWAVSEFGWRFIRENLSPEDILLRW